MRIFNFIFSYQNAFLLSQLKNAGHHIWIGLTDSKFEGTFLWTDQSSVDYTNWRGSEPNDMQGEDCAEFNSNYNHRGGWNDVSCDAKLKFACQKCMTYCFFVSIVFCVVHCFLNHKLLFLIYCDTLVSYS